MDHIKIPNIWRESAPAYVKFKHIGVYIEIWKQYGRQIKVNVWPALAASITDINVGQVQNGDQKNRNDYKFHKCISKYHLLCDYRIGRASKSNGESANSNGAGGRGEDTKIANPEGNED